MVGGAAGALLRWSLGLLIVSPPGGFPVATFVVNMTGAFGLGVAGVIFAERMSPTRFLRELIAIEFFGAYTRSLVHDDWVGLVLRQIFLPLIEICPAPKSGSRLSACSEARIPGDL